MRRRTRPPPEPPEVLRGERISGRLRNVLVRIGCETREDVFLVASRCSRQAFLGIKNVGRKTLHELERWLGVTLRDEPHVRPWDRLGCEDAIEQARAKAKQEAIAKRPRVVGVKRTRCSRKMRLRLSDRLRQRLSKVIRGTQKLGSAVHDLGCTVSELKAHLERQFLPGMTWENYGSGKGRWQIDHIYPLARTKLTDREALLRVCHYTNLQPLWWHENSRKGAKIIAATKAKQPAHA